MWIRYLSDGLAKTLGFSLSNTVFCYSAVSSLVRKRGEAKRLKRSLAWFVLWGDKVFTPASADNAKKTVWESGGVARFGTTERTNDESTQSDSLLLADLAGVVSSVAPATARGA